VDGGGDDLALAELPDDEDGPSPVVGEGGREPLTGYEISVAFRGLRADEGGAGVVRCCDEIGVAVIADVSEGEGEPFVVMLGDQGAEDGDDPAPLQELRDPRSCGPEGGEGPGVLGVGEARRYHQHPEPGEEGASQDLGLDELVLPSRLRQELIEEEGLLADDRYIRHVRRIFSGGGLKLLCRRSSSPSFHPGRLISAVSAVYFPLSYYRLHLSNHLPLCPIYSE